MTRPDFEVVRDPLWNNIRVDPHALTLIDSEPFQRLRYVRQLGHAFLVYPGATHSRFEHALGTYHLARRALALLEERGELEGIPASDATLVRMAALLHDIGHYPFSHALEEAGLPSHEALAVDHLEHPDIQAALEGAGVPGGAREVAALINGRSDSPLQGLISGSLDLDKLEYLTRDARMCGVPYGTVDVDRLLHSLTVVEGGVAGRTMGVHEKGISALESLLFAKYQMYRNVYWHHAVRSATVMFKRAVRTAIQQGALDAAWIAHSTDEALMERLCALPDAAIARRLRRRSLYKRAVDLAADAVPGASGDWIAADPDRTAHAEDALAATLRLEPGQVLIDFPAKPAMLAVDLSVRLSSGDVEPLAADGKTGPIGLPAIAEELHQSARRFRVYVAEPRTLEAGTVLKWMEQV